MDKEKVEAALDAARRGVLAIMKNEKRQFYEVDARLKKLNSSFDTYPTQPLVSNLRISVVVSLRIIILCNLDDKLNT